MKINKNTIILVLLLVLSLILSSCKPTMHEEPMVKVFNNSNEFKVIHYLDTNNKKQEDIEDRIKRVMVGQRFIDLPVVEFDEKIIIEPLNFETTKFEVYNYIVNEDGNIISEYDVEPITIATLEENKSEFIFEKPLNLDEYKENKVEGKSIHCLLFRSEIYNSSFAFGILVLGDEKEIAVDRGEVPGFDTIGILIDNTGFLIDELGEDETLKLLKKISSELKKDIDYKNNIDTIIEKAFKEYGIKDSSLIEEGKTTLRIIVDDDR